LILTQDRNGCSVQSVCEQIHRVKKPWFLKKNRIRNSLKNSSVLWFGEEAQSFYLKDAD
jgi:hypothetical protein